MNNNMWNLYLSLAMILLTSVASYPSRPSYIGCTSSEDCGVDECCVLGKYNYFLLDLIYKGRHSFIVLYLYNTL